MAVGKLANHDFLTVGHDKKNLLALNIHPNIHEVRTKYTVCGFLKLTKGRYAIRTNQTRTNERLRKEGIKGQNLRVFLSNRT